MMIVLLGSTIILACAQQAQYPRDAGNGFKDYGVAAPAQESRGVVACKDDNDHYLVLGNTMDFLLVTDIDTEETTQYWMPEGVAGSYPYGSIMASNGKFYICHGATFMEFDPTARDWTFHEVPEGRDGCYIGFTEGPDGVIWCGGCPNTRLVSFNPETRELKDYGQMDEAEKYLSNLAVDSSGWVYGGIGTARCNIVTCNPATGEIIQLMDEADRKHGTAVVYPAEDGKVYASYGGQHYRCFEGNIEKIAKEAAGKQKSVGNIGWGNTKFALPDGRRVAAYSMPERYMKIHNPETDETKTITFDYETVGASLTSLAAGPDDKIYGSSCHPMHFFVYDVAEDKLEDWGPVPGIGGGNFCAITTQGAHLVGAEYAGGRLYDYDTARPWDPAGEGDAKNPRMLAKWHQDICRPRTALAHPDGKTVMMAGFAGYGLCGGGIGMYDLETGEELLLAADEDVLPGHSTITLQALPNGNLVGGTSISAPGGGHTTATEAELYILDWKTKKVAFRTVPVPGDGNIISIQVANDGLVYGLSGNSTFFVFDPDKQELVHSESFAEYGAVPRHALHVGPDDNLYALMSRTIVKLAMGTFEHEKLADTPVPISGGGALHKGVLYYACDTHFWSYDVPGLD